MSTPRTESRPANDLSLNDHFLYLLPRLSSNTAPPNWPPDIFALCMSALSKSGKYCRVLTNWPPSNAETTVPNVAVWAEKVAAEGAKWQLEWPKIPERVSSLWKALLTNIQESLADLSEGTASILLELAVIADEACRGVGVVGSPGTPGTTANPENENIDFFNTGHNLLEEGKGPSSLCNEIDPTRVCVLPKMRTPQRGLTCRSLSHNLALCATSEIKPRWVVAGFGNADELSLNVMVIPWPFSVRPVQFRQTAPLTSEMRNMPAKDFGFFTFDSSNDEAVVAKVKELVDRGVEEMGKIHGIILPELALSPTQHEAISDVLLGQGRFLVAGVGLASRSGEQHGSNLIHIDIPGLQSIVQKKHHRWKLDRSQINQYGLGSRLHPERAWWEHISLDDRSLTFVCLLPWLTIAVLICEDLARPDPVGDLVRAVGPNLVVALLMDGPQLKDRWGSRYATTLADDPGSSVLTLTSLGMCGLSRPASGQSRDRIIALWKDADTSSPVEIELPPDAEAMVISLSVRYLEEWSADGRSDATAGYPLISGIHPIRRSSN